MADRSQPLARRLLRALLPEDDWSAELLSELDDQWRRVAGAGGRPRPGLWYLRQAFAPRTIQFVWLSRQRSRRGKVVAEKPALAGIASDVRIATRRLGRELRTTAFIAATLGLGIGSTAAMYGVADRLFLRGPLHVSGHEKLTRFFLQVNDVGGERTSPWIPYATALALQDGLRSLEGATLYRYADDLARLGGGVTPVRVSAVDGHFFPILGTVPAAGHFFTASDPAGSATAVISHALARASHGSAANAVGQPIELSLGSFVVGAVAPAGFAGPHLERVDVWVPMDASRAHTRNWWLLGRQSDVASGGSARLRGEAQQIHDRTDPGRFFQWAVGARIGLAPVDSDDAGQQSAEASVARLLLAVMTLVLLVACANAVNLLLARVQNRRREVVVRVALGGGRWRFARMFVVETGMLGVLGGLVSLPVAYWGGTALRSVLLPQVAWGTTPLDVGVLGIACFFTVVAAAILGLFPAQSANRTDVAAGLTATRSTGGRSHARTQVALATGQVALSATLLLCAGLFVESFRTIRVTDLGIAADEAYSVELRAIDGDRLQHGAADEVDAYERALAALRSSPVGVRSALSVGLPFGNTFGTSVTLPGRDSIPELPGDGPYVSAVGDGYFSATGTAVLRGAAIDEGHVARGVGVVVVSQTTADLLWPNEPAIGSCVRLGDPTSECRQVIGVSADVHRQGYREPRSLQFYIPLGTEFGFSGTSLVVRPPAGSTRGVVEIRRLLGEALPDVDHVDVVRMDVPIQAELRPWRLGAIVLTVTSSLAALVSIIGVYGVLSYMVQQRRREIGVRMALGATGVKIRTMVLRVGLGTGVAGVLLGFAAVFAGRGAIGPLLFETSVSDPIVMASVGALMVGAATLACTLPARHAASIAPADCLRNEDG